MPTLRRLHRRLSVFAILGSLALPIASYADICEPGTPNAMLQNASPKNWVLLAMGGPTNVSITGPSLSAGSVNPNIGIAASGHLTVDGASAVRADVYLNAQGMVNQTGPSYIQSVVRDEGADQFVRNARLDALSGAHCAAGLAATVNNVKSIQIDNPSSNLTIEVNERINVLNLTDLVLTNGTLTLTSKRQSDPPPTIILNITGKFKVNGPSKIVLEGTLDELHVLYNVIGTGDDVSIAGGLASDSLPTSQVSGVLLVPMRNVVLSSALVNGTVIGGGQNITISSGAQIVSHVQ